MIDCIRICFRVTELDMEKADTLAISLIHSINTAMEAKSLDGPTAQLVDTSIRCIINGTCQGGHFQASIHSQNGYRVAIQVKTFLCIPFTVFLLKDTTPFADLARSGAVISCGFLLETIILTLHSKVDVMCTHIEYFSYFVILSFVSSETASMIVGVEELELLVCTAEYCLYNVVCGEHSIGL